MTTEIRIGPQSANVDRDATLALYRDTITKGGADGCSCTYCRNFSIQRAAVYPQEFVEFLNRIGVDPRKELEVFDLDRVSADSTRRLYGGWFAFCGAILEGDNWRPERELGSFAYWITNSFPTAGLPEGVCAVEFLCELPWKIPESPEEP